MLNWPKLSRADGQSNCNLQPQKIEAKRVAQEMTETRIIQQCFFPTTTHPNILISRDKSFLKCYILPNPPWLLIRYFQILGDFHDLPQDQTMMLKVFLDDDLRSTAQDHEKIESYQWQNQSKGRIIYRTQQSMNIIPPTMKKDAPPWPSGTIALTTTMSPIPNRGQMFIIEAGTSRVGIGIALMQDDQL
ncbi:hypothetical protein BHE74_00032198 [Ensete ventricosum]|nr:hypothetical protein BHE74_00032198 [Ensete ventricosum]